jgi:hypothetical protein
MRLPPLSVYTEPQAAAMGHFVTLLIEADEPRAMLASLKLIAEHKAFTICRKMWGAEGTFTRGAASDEGAKRWLALAKAIEKVEREMRIAGGESEAAGGLEPRSPPSATS